MIDIFEAPLMTPIETAQNLLIPERTIRRWLADKAAGRPLVHSVTPERKGHPSVPFIGLVEAHVLRTLRSIGLSHSKIADAATEIRHEFSTEYGLANRRIATDGVDVFIQYLESDEMARVGDHQTPVRGVIDSLLRYITWTDEGEYPVRLTLRTFDPKLAEVVIDPRFAWGAPIVEPAHVPVSAVLGMYRAGESPDAVADEYGLDVEQVRTLIRVAA